MSRIRQDVLALGVAIILFFILRIFVTSQTSFALCLYMYVFYVLICENWDKRIHRRFWYLLSIFFIAHFLCILALDLKEPIRPAIIGFPIALADLFIMDRIVAKIKWTSS